MKKMKNETHIEGFLYEHNLAIRVTGDTAKTPGVTYIRGSIGIATDDECLNVVPVYFNYVTKTTSTGSTNNTFTILEKIANGQIKNIMTDGKEEAAMLRIDSAIALNEWYKDDELISTKRNEGGFVHQVSSLCDEALRGTFETDIIINSCVRKEADEERNIPEKVIVRGGIFNFKKEFLPVEFSVLHPGAMNYFESLDASKTNPVFTRVKGVQKSQTIVRRIEEESAFGEPSVRTTTSSYKDFVINWAQPEPYDWDSEDTILASELVEALSAREIHKAELKRKADEYKDSNKGAATPAPTTTAKTDYKF